MSYLLKTFRRIQGLDSVKTFYTDNVSLANFSLSFLWWEDPSKVHSNFKWTSVFQSNFPVQLENVWFDLIHTLSFSVIYSTHRLQRQRIRLPIGQCNKTVAPQISTNALYFIWLSLLWTAQLTQQEYVSHNQGFTIPPEMSMAVAARLRQVLEKVIAAAARSR